jgi:hypothetical protein
MMDADATVVLMEPILLAIKQVTGRDYRKVEAFNDARSTSHGLVLRVLHQTRDNILSGRVAAPPARPSRWARLQRLVA